MNKYLKKFFLLICLVVLSLSVLGQNKEHPDDKYYSQGVLIQGKITILNHPSLGKTEGRNIGIIFQKVGCKDCLIFVNSDSNGNYSVGLGRGKYRVIMREVRGGLTPSYDLLAPSQPRIIDSNKSGETLTFDIQMMLSEK